MTGGAPTFVRLMLPGDLVGVEALAGVAPRIEVGALTPSLLVPVDLPEGKLLTQMWMDAVAQAHHRARDMATMRTGRLTSVSGSCCRCCQEGPAWAGMRLWIASCPA